MPIQITDVEIDKVNKPYLPIPAGNLTPRAAKATVSLCLLAGVALGLAPCSLGSPGLAVGGWVLRYSTASRASRKKSKHCLSFTFVCAAKVGHGLLYVR